MRLLPTLRTSDTESIRQFGAFVIAALALLLSISGVGDSNATEEGARNNVLAADAFAWYQAKNIRQTSYELARDELKSLLELKEGSLSPGMSAELGQRLNFYEAEIQRYEDEPDPEEPGDLLKGEGKKQLLARAEDYNERRLQAGVRGNSFDYAVVASGLGIVLASAGIMIGSIRFIIAGSIAGFICVLFLLNAAFGLVNLGFYIT